MTTKGEQLLSDALAQFGHQQAFVLEDKVGLLVAYIEELERKAQVYDEDAPCVYCGRSFKYDR